MVYRWYGWGFEGCGGRTLTLDSPASGPLLPSPEQSVAEYIRQYPEWNETDLITLRDQFLVFDQNEDGIIDCSELCGAN